MAKNFLEKFFKKVLDIGGEQMYNVPVATQQGNETKTSKKQN